MSVYMLCAHVCLYVFVCKWAQKCCQSLSAGATEGEKGTPAKPKSTSPRSYTGTMCYVTITHSMQATPVNKREKLVCETYLYSKQILILVLLLSTEIIILIK
ncbi:hypothetical protein XENOCAPTIV_026534 [Xenoophorus captivus]|uniref:Secreted protein n=1 Tax=Xenoophorus captivus TaxID=1517983 RepID=A0ABV0QUU4_9TELE